MSNIYQVDQRLELLSSLHSAIQDANCAVRDFHWEKIKNLTVDQLFDLLAFNHIGFCYNKTETEEPIPF